MKKVSAQRLERVHLIRDACGGLLRACGRPKTLKGLLVRELDDPQFLISQTFIGDRHWLDIWHEGEQSRKVLHFDYVGENVISLTFRRGSWEEEVLSLARAKIPPSTSASSAWWL